MASSRQANAIWGPKNSRIPGPNPIPLAHVMYLPASKTLRTRTYKSQVHFLGGFMYKSPLLRGLHVHTSILPYVCIPPYLRVHTHTVCQPEIDQGGEECGKVTLPHCSPTPTNPSQLRLSTSDKEDSISQAEEQCSERVQRALLNAGQEQGWLPIMTRRSCYQNTGLYINFYFLDLYWNAIQQQAMIAKIPAPSFICPISSLYVYPHPAYIQWKPKSYGQAVGQLIHILGGVGRRLYSGSIPPRGQNFQNEIAACLQTLRIKYSNN